MTFDLALRAIIIPFSIAAIIAIIAWRPWKQGGAAPGRRGAMGMVLAIALPFCIAYFMSEDRWPSLPPAEKQQWLAHFALMVMTLGAVTALWREPKWFNWIFVPGVMLAAALLIRLADLPDWFIRRTMITFGLITVCWLVLEPLARKRDGITVPLLCTLLCVGAAPIVLVSGFESWWALVMSLASASGCLFLISLWKPSVSLAHGGVFTFLALLIAVLMMTAEYQSGSFPAFVYYLPPLSIAAGWIGELRTVRTRAAWQRVLLVVVIAAIPIAVAVFFTIRSAPDASLYVP